LVQQHRFIVGKIRDGGDGENDNQGAGRYTTMKIRFNPELIPVLIVLGCFLGAIVSLVLLIQKLAVSMSGIQ
jgi:hypothetical protein